MFEAAELGQRVSKRTYTAAVPKLRSEVLQAHFALREARVPVIIIASGVDGAGKGEVIHRLNEWLDPRGVDTYAFWKNSDEETERPYYWRFWKALPARGRIAILFGSWYSSPTVRRVYGKLSAGGFNRAMDRIAFFERMLVDDGALIIKLWYHLNRREQRKRIQQLEADPESRWRILPTDKKHLKRYDTFIKVTAQVIRRTDVAYAPWHIIEATDRRYRELTTGRIILRAIRERLKRDSLRSSELARHRRLPPAPRPPAKLDRVNLEARLAPTEYREELKRYQARLGRMMWEAYRKGVSNVLLFEGWDAAGKGSAIRRVTQAIDPRLYRTVSIAAPTEEKKARHYLWRFWRHLPRAGTSTIYDRSWYGRVLVERIEGYAEAHEWRRAYAEINDFEEQLSEGGIVLSKFWIHITKEEQLKRFRQRQEVPFKQHKITDEDWRNREKWESYALAVDEMVARTSTESASWTLVAGNDKRYARVQILKTLCRRLEKAL